MVFKATVFVKQMVANCEDNVRDLQVSTATICQTVLISVDILIFVAIK